MFALLSFIVSLCLLYISDTFDSNHCVILLRMMDGLDVSDHFGYEGEKLFRRVTEIAYLKKGFNCSL